MAERFLYLPTVGFSLVLGWGAARLLGPVAWGRTTRIRPVPSLGLAAVLLVYALLTLWRNEDWRDEYRLYSRMVETAPAAAMPHLNLAFTQLARGEIGPANQHLREAVRLAPGSARANAGLGLTETVLGDREAGLRHGLAARALAPGNADVLASLGALYLHRGEPALALPELTESLRLKPNQVHAALNRVPRARVARPAGAGRGAARARARARPADEPGPSARGPDHRGGDRGARPHPGPGGLGALRQRSCRRRAGSIRPSPRSSIAPRSGSAGSPVPDAARRADPASAGRDPSLGGQDVALLQIARAEGRIALGGIAVTPAARQQDLDQIAGP